jgi:hypothetical protein
MAAGRKTGGGSRKGRPNKHPSDIKAMIIGALNAGAGGQAFFEQQKKQNPIAFMGLIAKVLPLQVQASAGGVNLLEQLATAAMAIKAQREAAALPAPAPTGPIIDAEALQARTDDSSGG